MSQFNGSVFGQQQRTGNLRLFEMSAEEPSYPAGDKADDKSLPLIARLQMVDERFTPEVLLSTEWRNGEESSGLANRMRRPNRYLFRLSAGLAPMGD